MNSVDLNKLIQFTGVNSKRTSNGRFSTLDLCIEAFKEILLINNVSPREIEIVVFITQSPNYTVPGSSYFVQREIQLSKSCVLLDLNVGCIGWIKGLFIIKSIMKEYNFKYGVILNGDTDVLTDINDSSTYPIMGDAGVATLFENRNDFFSDMKFEFSYNGNYSHGITEKPNVSNVKSLRLTMNSPLIANYLLTEVIPNAKDFIQKNKINPDFFIPHQANKYFVNTISNKLEFPIEKTLLSYPFFGNTSSASIPLTLCVNDELTINKTIYCLAFGVGMSCAQLLLKSKVEIKTKLVEI